MSSPLHRHTSLLTDFYSEKVPNIDGLYFEQILDMDNEELETSHNLIQWLFPLQDPSNFNADAPVLTEQDIQDWRINPVLRINLLRAYGRILQFFGLKQVDTISVVEDEISGPALYF